MGINQNVIFPTGHKREKKRHLRKWSYFSIPPLNVFYSIFCLLNCTVKIKIHLILTFLNEIILTRGEGSSRNCPFLHVCTLVTNKACDLFIVHDYMSHTKWKWIQLSLPLKVGLITPILSLQHNLPQNWPQITGDRDSWNEE